MRTTGTAAEIACIFHSGMESEETVCENVELSLLFRNYTKYHMIMLLLNMANVHNYHHQPSNIDTMIIKDRRSPIADRKSFSKL